jgi:hypothetical protein
VAPGADWADLAVAGARTTVEAPLRRWTVTFQTGDGTGVEAAFTAAGPPAALEVTLPRAGGVTGYEQVCRVSGTATAGGHAVRLDCVGERGHSWGAPDWSRLALARSVGVWGQDGTGAVLSALRPRKASDHGAEALSAAVLRDGRALAVADPRLSTASDADGRQRRAGLELWLEDEDGEEDAVRADGRVRCGTTIALGRLRLQCAFFDWLLDGRPAVGRYELLRPA